MIVKIDNLDHSGRGITRIGNKITFVSNALPNEIVDIKLLKEKKNYNEAEATNIIEPSPDRVNPSCPYYNECGGCELLHMSYDSQVSFKKEKVKNILKKYAGIDLEPEIFASNNQFHYRNKITLHKQGEKLGYMKKSTNEIIEINNCPLAMESINDYINNIQEMDGNELVIRTNEKGEIISTIKDKPLIIKINEYNFYVDIKSFFQVNNYICSCIFNYIKENIKECNTCLDLYSGVGTLSILASSKAKNVYGIEINESSHKNALKNLELNNIKNVHFLLGPVEEKIKDITSQVDLIITDPPRSGMDKSTIEVIKQKKPKELVYMSCDPMTLARDLSDLLENYNIEKCAVFDMFPNTKHIETIIILNRKGD